jgi:hypothetical protein
MPKKRKRLVPKIGPEKSTHLTEGTANVRGRPANSTKHPVVGFMRGTVTIAPGVDLTGPADPEWGDVAYGDRKWDEK